MVWELGLDIFLSSLPILIIIWEVICLNANYLQLFKNLIQ